MGVAILSKWFNTFDEESKKREIPVILKKITNKLKNVPNTNFIDIWLQRLTLLIDPKLEYSDPLCKKVYDNEQTIWNSSWMRNPINENDIINRNEIKKLKLAIPKKDVILFGNYPF